MNYRLKAVIGVWVVLAAGATTWASEIGFIEDFSLATNRTVVLGQLIPGDETCYFYTCLNYQNQTNYDKVEETLKLWMARYGETAGNIEIRNRHALLTYGKNPQASLEYLKRKLGLTFNHQQERFGEKPSFATQLDQKVIGPEALTARALADGRNTVNGFENSAFDRLVGMALDGDQRRDLLRKLQRPAYPGLVKLVAADLDYQNAQPFGSYTIHRQLLLSQLDELLALKPNLLNETAFVTIYLSKLQPGPDVDWQHDAAQRAAFLDRQWAFVKKLAPAHNSLKLNILYQRLTHDRALGNYDKDRFMEYIRIPRSAGYVNPKYLERPECRDSQARFGADFSAVTLMPPVPGDDALVRDYLAHFFLKEDDYRPYQDFILDTYLRQVFAETKILNGIGDMEKWYSLLNDPAAYQALKDRIEIEFAPVNKTLFAVEEPVGLDVDLKNVKNLIVKVFEINTLSYYRDKLEPINTAIDLDGLVASHEDVTTYDDPPLRRIRRHFDFPFLNKRGVFVIEFIGNGKSSRALVQKGAFQYLERVGAAGHVFTVLDERNQKVNGATLWLGGHEYRADTNGLIAVPYSTNPGRQQILISQGGFTTLDTFEHRAENYTLAAGIYVDRESLLKGKEAKVVIRPSLTVNGVPIALSLLEEPALQIESTDAEGVKTTKDVKDLKLSSEQETVCEFQVPENLKHISFLLKGKIQNLSLNRKDDLADGDTFSLNQIDSTARIEDLHLSRTPEGYVLRLLGKNGEPKNDRPVNLVLKHRDFVSPVNVTLQSDADGRVTLGELKGIVSVQATGPDNTPRAWNLPRDRCTLPATIHARVGDKIVVPYLGGAAQPGAAEFALLEKRGTTYVQDWLPSLALKDGFVEIAGLPMGTFELWLKESNETIALEVTDGEVRNGYVMGANRLLEVKNPQPLRIGLLHADGDQVTIKLSHATPLTRVHVAAARFMPAYSIFDALAVRAPAEPQVVLPGRAESLYVSGRDIGDEYRYILERKYARKFPGNLLTRPSLLLNPWALRSTETGNEALAVSGVYGSRSSGGRGRALSMHGGGGGARKQDSSGAVAANLDFLSDSAVVLANLKPDANGVVTIPRKALGVGQQIRVVAVNANNVVYRELLVPEVPLVSRDLRLANALDTNRHFTEQKQISVVPVGGSLVIADLASSKVELYDTLRKVYGLYVTLSADATLQEFGFINDWAKLTPAQKQEKYSKYACHELNFFLYKKDRAFFDKAIQPYLKNKKDKTFLDYWLIGDDLSAYLQPWAYGRLNIVERILLARRIKGEAGATARHVKDLQDMIPPDLDRLNQLYLTALKGSALEKDMFLTNAMNASDLPAAGEAAFGVAATAGVPSAPALAMPAKPAALKEKAASRAEAKREVAKDAMKKADRQEEAEGYAGAELADEEDGKADVGRRGDLRQLFRKLERTQEWAENNYYHQPIESQNGELVTVSPFWLDYARHGEGPFFSTHLAEAARNFTEMMFALAVLDLPSEAPKLETTNEGPKLTLKPGTPVVAFHKEIKESAPAKDAPPILISQNYFLAIDRYRYENGERFDKFVTDEFLSQVVYGCQVVLTDPASSPEKLDVLLQIPKGALPVSDGFYTRSRPVRLEPFSTLTMEYYFYFPKAGDYPHFPAHVAKKEQFVAAVAPKALKVVEIPTKVDTTSWDYVSQNGKPEDVLAFLDNDNPVRLNLERIAWRLRDKDFFGKVTELLARRHVYNQVLWSYGIYNNVPAAIREYLQHADDFLSACGRYLDCQLVTIDPVARKSYQHLEYSPLVNARAHTVGKRREIVNERLAAQYQEFLGILSYRSQPDNDDLLGVTYYLLLQDRIEEAQRFFARVDGKAAATKVQYDYLQAYLDFYTPEHKQARRIAEAYRNYPVDRWRNLFTAVLTQLDELEGKGPAVVDKENRDQQQTRLAATEASFDFAVESRKVTVTCQNLKEAVVNYYKMDVELLFSRNPFVRQETGQFAYIQPNQSETIKLAGDGKPLTFDLPKAFHNSNVMVEIIAGGVKKVQPYFANSLAVQVVETYGQVKVTNQKSGAPLSQVYVKVFVRTKDGAVKFYKDGYTDLRGRFDYASLNTNEIDQADKLALLILSDTDGAVIREVNPPKQ